MPFVQTVLGPVASQELGRVSSHEHVFCDARCYSGEDWKKPENAWLREPVKMEDLGRIWYNLHRHLDNVVLSDPVAQQEELTAFSTAGGGTIVDCTSIGLDRRPEELRRISRETGIHILMGTGAYLEIAMPDSIRDASVETLTALFDRELRQGVEDTGIRAGFVGEIGISERFTPAEQRVLRAGARAAGMAGTAILIHQPGLEHQNLHILDLIEAEGCPANRVVLSHNDVFWDQPEYLIPALERGAYLCFDTFGLQMVLNWTIPFPRDWDRLQIVRDLIWRGYGKQLLFGQDTCFKVQLLRYGGWGYSHLLREICPLALRNGWSQDWLDDIMIQNPARVFCGSNE